jgi:hypothetical protein
LGAQNIKQFWGKLVKNTFIKSAVGLVTAGSFAFCGGTIAHAEITSSPWDSSSSLTAVDSSCIEQLGSQDSITTAEDLINLCTVTTVLRTNVQVEEFRGSRLSRIVEPTIYSKTWQIEKIGGTYVEISRGKFYYDGSKAWSTKSYRGYAGYHECQAPGSWGITVDVSVESCTTSYSTSGASVTDREKYKVSAIANGFPIFWVLAMSELSTSTGATEARAF